MTKERKLAIKIWEGIVEHCKDEDFNLDYAKEAASKYNWKFDCWFCQYVRSSERHAPYNGCAKCPLFHYEIKRGNVPRHSGACGCCYYDWQQPTLYYCVRKYKDKTAAEIILRLLRGGKL